MDSKKPAPRKKTLARSAPAEADEGYLEVEEEAPSARSETRSAKSTPSRRSVPQAGAIDGNEKKPRSRSSAKPKRSRAKPPATYLEIEEDSEDIGWSDDGEVDDEPRPHSTRTSRSREGDDFVDSRTPATRDRQSTSPTERREGRAEMEGIARGIKVRTDFTPRAMQSGQTASVQGRKVMNFHLDRYDGSGNRLRPVPVELAARGISGHIDDGDEVRVEGKWKRGTLHARKAFNVTTGAEVVPWTFRGNPKALVTVVMFLLIFGGFGAFLVASAMRGTPKLPGPAVPGSSGAKVSSTQLIVPDVVGDPTAFAASKLRHRGFTQLSFVAAGTASDFLDGCTVSAVTPAPGTAVKKDAAIRLTFLESPNKELDPTCPGTG